ncbi:hypothetical protein C7Y69_10900 [Alteromonas sp. KS69]|jgi:hypothetical protein|uniref:Uncharacterized protein n=1 Tax=Alteromonas naphthalenivorans TaxID=715451 RepID=F5Z5Y2_ALTNA|nr:MULTISPECIES: hypothetical protein [Alteromonas]AEF05215.1 hypothetical protein ambt_18610 [Alteromonas naphthalenivorans]MBO7921865.1 hypothetical protein [Alteromonas sp. K632G]PHS56010.1 MAG: hypothetical protein COB03_07980 [Alteromonas sp.]RUP80847.1 hypothetical protein C7Y69_10900 [Alteromonas sp. KS69]|tara:strand:+ start:600 stop:830 length:231 start_codon:yes stop_codon:yes gene_type:complete
MATLLYALALAICAYLVYSVAIIRLQSKMKRREDELRKVGVTPSGSGLCHGMKLNHNKSGVIKDQKKSSAWYSRLA